MTDTGDHPYDIRLDDKYGTLALIDIPAEMAANEPWFNQTLTTVNDAVVRLGIVEGDFHWHKHDDQDEFFLVLDGQLLIDLDDRPTVTLDRHQGYTVPRGVTHRTRAPERDDHPDGRGGRRHPDGRLSEPLWAGFRSGRRGPGPLSAAHATARVLLSAGAESGGRAAGCLVKRRIDKWVFDSPRAGAPGWDAACGRRGLGTDTGTKFQASPFPRLVVVCPVYRGRRVHPAGAPRSITPSP